jgi:hypothetical protein
MGQENSFPNVEGLTVDGASANSRLLTPERELSFRQVRVPAKSVTSTSTAAVPLVWGFASSVAVTTFELATLGGVNKPVWLMVPGTHAPAGTQATAQFTSLLLTPAVCTFSCSGGEVVTLASDGEMLSCPWIERAD